MNDIEAELNSDPGRSGGEVLPRFDFLVGLYHEF
jgi:hypothetical protein